MNEKPFQWCFIGTGRLAGEVAEQLVSSGRHQVKTVCSRRFEKAKEFADKWGGTAFEDAASAISAEGVEGVYVVTPHPAHYKMAKLALSLGKPVLCEKPFTMQAEETRDLFRTAEEKGVYLVEGMWPWFAPAANKVKSWLDSGEIGEVKSVETHFRVYVMDYAARLTDPNQGGGALLDSGVYPLTFLYRLFGKPAEIKCVGNLKDGIDLSEEISLTFENGFKTDVSVAIDSRDFDNYIRIQGTKGTIYTESLNCPSRVELKRTDGEIEIFEAPTTMLNEFDKVAEEIRLGKKQSSYVPPQATIDIMEVMDTCRRQMNLVYPFEKKL